jgi:carbonic anhydrase/acetyltransferase-like protein (isoleucine patch superfamily)
MAKSVDKFDFGDGYGPVPAHRHKNPDGSKGGWVANTAKVDKTAYVGENACVFRKASVIDRAKVLDYTRVFDFARVIGSALITGKALIYDHALIADFAQINEVAEVFEDAEVFGRAKIYGAAKVSGNVLISDNVQIFDAASVFDDAQISESAKVYGFSKVYDSALVSGETQIHDHARIYGNAKVYGKSEIFEEAQVCENARVYGEAMVAGRAIVDGNTTVKGKKQVTDRKGKVQTFISYLSHVERKLLKIGFKLGKQLGEGTQGVVYDMVSQNNSNEFVIKFTKDPRELAAWQRLDYETFNHPNFVKIHKIGYIDALKDLATFKYFLIMEKLVSLSSFPEIFEEVKKVDSVLNLWDFNTEIVAQFPNFDEFLNFVFRQFDSEYSWWYSEEVLKSTTVKGFDSLSYFKATHPIKYQFMKDFFEAMSVLAEKGISYKDSHMGNVMIDPKTKDFKLIDLGYSDLDTALEMASIEVLQEQKRKKRKNV